MRFFFIIYFTTLFNSWALDIQEKFIPQSGSVDVTVSVSSTGRSTWTSLNVSENLKASTANLESVLAVSFNTGSIDLIQDTNVVLTGGDGGLTIDTDTIYVDALQNRVGISTTSPQAELHIVGAASTASLFLEESTNNKKWDYQILSNGSLVISESGVANRVAYEAGGQIGFGTVTPSYALEVAGGAVAGAGAYVNTSDKRLKTSTEPVQGACSILDNLDPVYFHWKSAEQTNPMTSESFRTEGRDFEQINSLPNGMKDIGFLAQDVEPHFPQAVLQNDKGIYNMSYSKIIPLLVGCIKEIRQ